MRLSTLIPQRAAGVGFLAALAVIVSSAGPVAAAPAVPGAPVIDIVDTDATSETNSLYQYLLDQQGQGILFGHQHTTDNGITFSEADGRNSDVFTGTGEYPAVFGWDTLILEGLESPGSGSLANGEANARAWADGMINAHNLGGINTISAHMKNFVTDRNFNDSSGRVVSQILPGGPNNAEFNEYLDLIALTADLTVDAQGKPIPLIFRPFHENTGSWFWWGAAHATAGEFKEIFRYTVEYLRDTKGVSNLLYTFSPNGSFGGDQERYLATYPGDDWVDVLGYDSYDYDNSLANSDAWIESVRVDLGMVTDLAAERGKIPAFTEFGRNGERTIKPTGNKSLTYYTDLLKTIKEDPKAKRITYMQTWSNWGLDQFYVPYPAYGTNPEHEMYRDFLAFFNDPFTVFSAGVEGAYTREANAEPAEPTLRIVSPADGMRVTTPATRVRIKATVEEPESVYFMAGDSEEQITLIRDPDGYYSADWVIGEENLTNKAVTLTVVADYGDESRTAESTLILGEPAELPLGVVDDFETYSDDAALRSAYAFNNATASDLSLTGAVNGSGTYGAEFAYDFTARTYGGFGKVFPMAQDWSGFNQINAWLDPDGGNQKLVLQVNTSNGQSFEAYPSLAGTEPTDLAINIADFRAKSDPTRGLSREDLTGVTEFWVYINQVGEPSSGQIVLDDIRAVTGNAAPTLPTDPGTEPETPQEPGIVDTFENYADTAALRAAWTRAGAANLTLTPDNRATGDFGAGFAFSGGFTDFQKAIDSDWSAFDEVQFWVDPDGSEQKIVLQLVADGLYYDAVPVISGAEPQVVSVPFSEFTPAPFQNRDPSLRPTPAELANVQQLVMFIESTSTSTSTTGTYFFDDIRAAVADDVEPVPNAPAFTATTKDLNRDNRGGVDGLDAKHHVRGQDLSISAGGFAADEWVWVSIPTAALDLGWARADADGRATLATSLPSELRNGAHSLALTGQDDGRILWERFIVKPTKGAKGK